MVSSLLLYLFLNYTRTGAAIRVVSQNRESARLMGINVKFIYLLTFGLGAAVTGNGGLCSRQTTG